jgi:hypothetical protein
LQPYQLVFSLVYHYFLFLEAFEDFPSTKNVSIESFQNMLQRRGYIPDISWGAKDIKKVMKLPIYTLNLWDLQKLK